MAKFVMFSHHAVQRCNQRLNINIPRSNEVNIEDAFQHAATFRHATTNRMQEAWITRDLSKRVVLIIDQENRVILTVMTEGPYVEKLYARAKH